MAGKWPKKKAGKGSHGLKMAGHSQKWMKWLKMTGNSQKWPEKNI